MSERDRRRTEAFIAMVRSSSLSHSYVEELLQIAEASRNWEEIEMGVRELLSSTLDILGVPSSDIKEMFRISSRIEEIS